MRLTYIVFFIMLSAAALCDFRTRTVPVWLYTVMAILGGFCFIAERKELLYYLPGGVLAGGIFFLTGRKTGEIGTGDSLFLLLSGIYLDIIQLLRMTGWGLLAALLWGLYRRYRKKQEEPLPFLPCLLTGYLIILGGGVF